MEISLCESIKEPKWPYSTWHIPLDKVFTKPKFILHVDRTANGSNCVGFTGLIRAAQSMNVVLPFMLLSADGDLQKSAARCVSIDVEEGWTIFSNGPSTRWAGPIYSTGSRVYGPHQFARRTVEWMGQALSIWAELFTRPLIEQMGQGPITR